MLNLKLFSMKRPYGISANQVPVWEFPEKLLKIKKHVCAHILLLRGRCRLQADVMS